MWNDKPDGYGYEFLPVGTGTNFYLQPLCWRAGNCSTRPEPDPLPSLAQGNWSAWEKWLKSEVAALSVGSRDSWARLQSMGRCIGPWSIGGRHRLESKPWRDRLGVGREEPHGCNYRWRHNDLVGSDGRGVIPAGNRRRREPNSEFGAWSDSRLRTWLDSQPKNRPAWLHHQPICWTPMVAQHMLSIDSDIYIYIYINMILMARCFSVTFFLSI
jgi:hypothetical protein